VNPPAGLVVPPIELKTSTVAVPVDVEDCVTLVVGVNIAIRAISLTEIVYCRGLLVEVVGPETLAYSQHKNLKPELAVAVKVRSELAAYVVEVPPPASVVPFIAIVPPSVV